MSINLKTFSKVRKGMLNAAEIAKQADAMLAEREQEMKELEQQKRRARDIMFKKTQQLKVCPPRPISPQNPDGLKPDVHSRSSES